MRFNMYLRFDGNCREALNYYARHLGGTLDDVMTWGDSPMADQADAATADQVMHASMSIGNIQLMGTDATPQHPYQGIQGAHLVYDAADAAEAERVFALLADNGRIEMPMEETFWAERFGMLTDRFGVPWMVNCSKPE